jgi:hypothetical protein
MSKITSDIQVSPSELYAFTSTKGADLGARGVTGDGREFRYVKAGAVELVPGKLQQAPAVVSNLQNVAVAAAAAVGDTSVTLTISSTAVVANEYDGGLLVINDANGEGQTMRIASHTSGTITSIVLQLEDPLITALTTSSEACVMHNPYNGVIVNPTTPTAKPVGVAISKIPAGQFGWIQTKGMVSCLNDGNTAAGLAVAPSQATAGAVKTGATTLDSVGSAAQAGVTTEYRLIDLRL